MKAKFPLGAVIGAAAGIIAGVLTAPKSGKETRDDIKSKAEELKKKAAEAMDKAVDETKNLKEKIHKGKETKSK